MKISGNDCDDLDECEDGSHKCSLSSHPKADPTAEAICKNKIGSYECSCPGIVKFQLTVFQMSCALHAYYFDPHAVGGWYFEW